MRQSSITDPQPIAELSVAPCYSAVERQHVRGDPERWREASRIRLPHRKRWLQGEGALHEPHREIEPSAVSSLKEGSGEAVSRCEKEIEEIEEENKIPPSFIQKSPRLLVGDADGNRGICSEATKQTPNERKQTVQETPNL